MARICSGQFIKKNSSGEAMVLVGDQKKKNPESSAAPPPYSEVTAEEKYLLYNRLKPRRSQRTIHSRITILILVAAILGVLGAVFTIRLFPM
jgi:hypothetical protein